MRGNMRLPGLYRHQLYMIPSVTIMKILLLMVMKRVTIDLRLEVVPAVLPQQRYRTPQMLIKPLCCVQRRRGR